MNIDKLDRKKRYYQKNRNKILQSLREKRKPIKREAIAFIFGRNFLRFYSVFQKNIEKLLLAALVLSCTSFLIVESARTLATIEGAGALWKALLCELVLVGVSMLTMSTRKMQCLRSVVLVGIVALSLLNTIGGPLTHFSQARQNVRLKAEETVLLNRTLERKQTILARYLAAHRISGAKRLESEIAALSDRMTSVKRVHSELKSEPILALGFGITILFRLVIMAANVVFVSRLGQLFQERSSQKCRENVSTPAKLFLVNA